METELNRNILRRKYGEKTSQKLINLVKEIIEETINEIDTGEHSPNFELIKLIVKNWVRTFHWTYMASILMDPMIWYEALSIVYEFGILPRSILDKSRINIVFELSEGEEKSVTFDLYKAYPPYSCICPWCSFASDGFPYTRLSVYINRGLSKKEVDEYISPWGVSWDETWNDIVILEDDVVPENMVFEYLATVAKLRKEVIAKNTSSSISGLHVVYKSPFIKCRVDIAIKGIRNCYEALAKAIGECLLHPDLMKIYHVDSNEIKLILSKLQKKYIPIHELE